MFFVDAAHFVFGTFLCYLWSFTRIFVRAASGRQRFNVLGAWNAVTRQLIAVTNTTVVNTETMSELLRKIAALGLTGAITLVLDNARYQHNAAVKHGQSVGYHAVVPPLVLAQPEPDRTLVEVHQTSCPLRPLPSEVADFQAAIQEILDGIPTTYAQQLETLMTLNFSNRRCFTNGRVNRIKDMPDAAWDKYDDRVFTTAYQDWQKEVDGLADVDDLPDDKTMADDLERLIWALWVPRLRTKEIFDRLGGRIESSYRISERVNAGELKEVDVYARVYKPVDDCFVRLGI